MAGRTLAGILCGWFVLAAQLAEGAGTIARARSAAEVAKILSSEPLAKDFSVVRFNFKRRDPVEPSRFDTKVWAWMEDGGLAFRFEVQTKGATLRPGRTKKHDGPVWNDPCVAVLLDTNHDGCSYYQVMINDAGAVYDAYCYTPFLVDTTWESNARALVGDTPDGWTATVRIPFDALGAEVGAGDRWGINFLSFIFLKTEKEELAEGRRTYVLDNITAEGGKRGKIFEDERYESWMDSIGYDMWYSPKIKPTGKAHEISAWCPLGGTNFYHFQRRMMRADFFEAVSLGDNAEEGVVLDVRTRGGLISTGSKEGKTLSVGGSPYANRFQALARNGSDKSCKVAAKVLGPGGKARTSEISVAPRSIGLLDVPYDVAGTEPLRFEVYVNGKKRYESRYTPLPEYKSVIVPPAEGSFDKSLVFHDKSSDGVGAAYWPHHFDYGFKTHLAPFRRTLLLAPGIPHVLGELVDDAKESRAALVSSAGRARVKNSNRYNELDDWAEVYRAKGIRAVLFPSSFTYKDGKTGKIYDFEGNELSEGLFRGRPYLFGDSYNRNYLANLRYGLERYGDVVWGIYSSDELNIRAIEVLQMIWESRKTGLLADEVARIVREVKDKYGGGKFGPPLSSEDTNPFRRLAFQRWYTDKSNAFGRLVSAEAKRLKPHVKVWGNDAHGFPYAAAFYKGAFDIAPDQVTYFPAIPGNVDADVKYLRDVTGLDVWPCAHIEGGAPLADAYELYSAVFRVGASGLLMYNVASFQFTVHDIWMAPERWKFETDLSRMFAEGLRAKTPNDPDVGIFVSIYSMMAASLVCEPRRAEYVSCYRVTGPKCGAWMKFFTERNMERGDVKLKNFKVIFVPYAPITTRKAAAGLLKAARDGATLVVADPEAFSYDLDAARLGKITNALYEGAHRMGEKEYSRGNFVFAWSAYRGRHEVPVTRFKENLDWPRAKTFALSGDLTTIVSGPTGECVAFMRDYGKGKLIVSGLRMFNCNPDPKKTGGGSRAASEHEGFVDFFRELFEREGVKLDRKIWRLKLPRPVYSPPRHQSFCLTNNAVKWEDNHPRSYLNVPLDGKYKLVPSPRSIPDVTSKQQDGWIAFARGKLTNARRVLRTPLAAMKYRDWMVRWNKAEAVRVDIDLGQPCEIRAVEALFADYIPAVSFGVGSDGARFEPFGEKANGYGKTLDTRMQSASGRAVARYIRLRAAGIPRGEDVSLAEIRVWGYPNPPEK